VTDERIKLERKNVMRATELVTCARESDHFSLRQNGKKKDNFE